MSKLIAVLCSTALPFLATAQNLSTNSNTSGAPVTVKNTASNPVPVTGSLTVSGSPNVQVVNPTSSPVKTQDVDNPARQPWQTELANGNFEYTVPSDKRLAIELISALCAVPRHTPPAATQMAFIGTTAGGTSTTHYFGVPYSSTDSIYDNWVGMQSVHIYADPGTTMNVGNNLQACGFSLSGYLIAK